ncbi:hypothetical protein D3C72_1754840 [compost metagenome]
MMTGSRRYSGVFVGRAAGATPGSLRTSFLCSCSCSARSAFSCLSRLRTRLEAGICTSAKNASTTAITGSQILPAPTSGSSMNTIQAMISTALARFT